MPAFSTFSERLAIFGWGMGDGLPVANGSFDHIGSSLLLGLPNQLNSEIPPEIDFGSLNYGNSEFDTTLSVIKLIGKTSIALKAGEKVKYRQVSKQILENIDIYSEFTPLMMMAYSLINGDLIWLSNQSNSSENGVYKIRSNLLLFNSNESDTFIDEGIIAIDKFDGDISRDVLIDYSEVDFNEVGNSYISYVVTNSLNISTLIKRQITIT
jgi:hypothetical protein